MLTYWMTIKSSQFSSHFIYMFLCLYLHVSIYLAVLRGGLFHSDHIWRFINTIQKERCHWSLKQHMRHRVIHWCTKEMFLHHSILLRVVPSKFWKTMLLWQYWVSRSHSIAFNILLVVLTIVWSIGGAHQPIVQIICIGWDPNTFSDLPLDGLCISRALRLRNWSRIESYYSCWKLLFRPTDFFSWAS